MPPGNRKIGLSKTSLPDVAKRCVCLPAFANQATLDLTALAILKAYRLTRAGYDNT